MRLFKARSVVNNFKEKERTVINWFVVGRKKPISGYEELIQDYCPNESESWCDELMADELFTEPEINELKKYLAVQHQTELQVEEVFAPLRSGGLSYSLLLISGENNFYTLADEQNYHLSVSVLGQYNAQQKKKPSLLSAEDIEKGISFLKLVFEKLNYTDLPKSGLDNLLNQIFAETGLHIQKSVQDDKTKKAFIF